LVLVIARSSADERYLQTTTNQANFYRCAGNLPVSKNAS